MADLIVIATKSYDLEAIIHQLKPCINEQTILLPLLNGVDSTERIQQLLPSNTILKGCAYIVSRLKQPGIIENSGNIQSIYFGHDILKDEGLTHLEGLFKKAGIDTHLSLDINTTIWEKFIFLSPIATATSYSDQCIGEILGDSTKSVLIYTSTFRTS